MQDQLQKNTSTKKKGVDVALNLIDSLLKDSDRKKISPDQVLIILDALAGADDSSLVTRFPAVLATCAQKGIAIDGQTLFSRYWGSSPKRQDLEKLLLVSTSLFKQENIKAPKNLEKITESVKRKYIDLFSGEILQLSNGVQVSIEDMRQTLKRYTSDLEGEKDVTSQTAPPWSRQLYLFLDRLFSPKQKELVFKKLNGGSFTKTEREYYSRIVRKKLEAIANEEVREIAAVLAGQPHAKW
jgi:hypothetical protein